MIWWDVSRQRSHRGYDNGTYVGLGLGPGLAGKRLQQPLNFMVLASAPKSHCVGEARCSWSSVIETCCSTGTIGSAALSLPSILAILRGGADNRSSALSSGRVVLSEPDDSGFISEGSPSFTVF